MTNYHTSALKKIIFLMEEGAIASCSLLSSCRLFQSPDGKACLALNKSLSFGTTYVLKHGFQDKKKKKEYKQNVVKM